MKKIIKRFAMLLALVTVCLIGMQQRTEAAERYGKVTKSRNKTGTYSVRITDGGVLSYKKSGGKAVRISTKASDAFYSGTTIAYREIDERDETLESYFTCCVFDMKTGKKKTIPIRYESAGVPVPLLYYKNSYILGGFGDYGMLLSVNTKTGKTRTLVDEEKGFALYKQHAGRYLYYVDRDWMNKNHGTLRVYDMEKEKVKTISKCAPAIGTEAATDWSERFHYQKQRETNLRRGQIAPDYIMRIRADIIR